MCVGATAPAPTPSRRTASPTVAGCVLEMLENEPGVSSREGRRGGREEHGGPGGEERGRAAHDRPREPGPEPFLAVTALRSAHSYPASQ